MSCQKSCIACLINFVVTRHDVSSQNLLKPPWRHFALRSHEAQNILIDTYLNEPPENRGVHIATWWFWPPRFPRMPCIHPLINRGGGPFHFPPCLLILVFLSRLLCHLELRRHCPPSAAPTQAAASTWRVQRTPALHHSPSASVSIHLLIPQIYIRVSLVHRCSSLYNLDRLFSNLNTIQNLYGSILVPVFNIRIPFFRIRSHLSIQTSLLLPP